MNHAHAGTCALAAALLLAAGIAAAAAPEGPGAAYRRGDYAEAIKLLLPAAKQGRADAQIMLGQMYLKGEGVPADPIRAAEWIGRAAEGGSPIAEYTLGVFSSSGIGGPKNAEAALRWYRRAAHQHYADAAFNLAVMYHAGTDTERNDILAFNWINAALDYLPAPSVATLRPRFLAVRDSIAGGLTPEQVANAARLASPDGPLLHLVLRDKQAFEKKATKEYPLVLGVRGQGGRAVVLVPVGADGTIGAGIVETSSAHKEFDEKTLKLLRGFLAEPRLIDGEAVDSWQIAAMQWEAHEAPWNFAQMNALPRPH